MRKTRKGSASYYKRKADKLFSEIVRARGRCEKCGGNGVLQCAHIIPRTNLTLRWDFENALCLDMKCHIWWQHKNPLEFTTWFKEKYPERYIYLMRRRNDYIKRTKHDYQNIVSNLEREKNSLTL